MMWVFFTGLAIIWRLGYHQHANPEPAPICSSMQCKRKLSTQPVCIWWFLHGSETRSSNIYNAAIIAVCGFSQDAYQCPTILYPCSFTPTAVSTNSWWGCRHRCRASIYYHSLWLLRKCWEQLQSVHCSLILALKVSWFGTRENEGMQHICLGGTVAQR